MRHSRGKNFVKADQISSSTLAIHEATPTCADDEDESDMAAFFVKEEHRLKGDSERCMTRMRTRMCILLTFEEIKEKYLRITSSKIGVTVENLQK